MGDPLGINGAKGVRVDTHVLHTVQHSPLQRILAFLNLSIDDVINNPVARTAVYYHWRIHNLIQRRCAAVDAEHIRRRAAQGLPLSTDDLEAMIRKSRKVI